MISNYKFQNNSSTKKSFTQDIDFKIENISSDICRIFFIDSKTFKEITIPDEIILYDDTNKNNINVYLNSFFITHFSNYEIKYKNETKIKIISKKEITIYQNINYNGI